MPKVYCTSHLKYTRVQSVGIPAAFELCHIGTVDMIHIPRGSGVEAGVLQVAVTGGIHRFVLWYRGLLRICIGHAQAIVALFAMLQGDLGNSSSSSDRGDTGDAAVTGSDPSLAIKQAVQLLQEAGGLLKIEDILPFFPDFVVIDHFQVGGDQVPRWLHHVSCVHHPNPHFSALYAYCSYGCIHDVCFCGVRVGDRKAEQWFEKQTQ